MKKILIEEVKVGVSDGGIGGCGPVSGNVVAEAKLRLAKDRISYYGMVEVDGTLNFYEGNTSRYEKEIAEAFDEENGEEIYSDGYCDYSDFYAAVEELQEEDKAKALLQKYMACLVRLSWEEVEKLKKASVGKAIGSFDIPVCDAEEEYLEDLEEEESPEE